MRKKQSKPAIYISSSDSDSDSSFLTRLQPSSHSLLRNQNSTNISSNLSTPSYNSSSINSSRRNKDTSSDEIEIDEIENDISNSDFIQPQQNMQNISKKLYESNKKSFKKLDLVPLTLKVVPPNTSPYDPSTHKQPLIESPGSKLMQKELQELKKNLDQLEKELDDDSDDEILQYKKNLESQNAQNMSSEIHSEINENPHDKDVKRIILIHKESNNLWKFNWTPNITLYSLIRKNVPKKLRKGNVRLIIDGKEWSIDELSFDIVHNDEYIYLVTDYSPGKEHDEVETKKLVLSFSDGTRKKIIIAVTKKWGDILKHFGTNWTRLLFDGEELNPDELISSNTDISNDDQIDVE